MTGLHEPYGHICTFVWDFLRMCLGFSQCVNVSFSHIPVSDYIRIGLWNLVLNAKEVAAVYVTKNNNNELCGREINLMTQFHMSPF